MLIFYLCLDGEIGRHARLRIWRSKKHVGSNPILSTALWGPIGPRSTIGTSARSALGRARAAQKTFMPRIHQIINKPRKKKIISSKAPALKNSPQKKGVCMRVYTRSPKKPNSATRKVANILVRGGAAMGGAQHRTIGYIPGEGHTLQEHSVVLIRGGRVKDLPGVKYHLIGGVFDFKNINLRNKKRSKYGIKRPN